MVQPNPGNPTPNSGWPFPKAEVMEIYKPAVEGMTNCSSAVCDAYTAMSTEWLNFVNRRVHTDLSFPAKLIKCSGPQDYFQEWAAFMKTAAEDYRNEFSRLAEMNTTATRQAMSAFQTNGSRGSKQSSTWPGF
jgi:hypothetical protein